MRYEEVYGNLSDIFNDVFDNINSIRDDDSRNQKLCWLIGRYESIIINLCKTEEDVERVRSSLNAAFEVVER